MSSNELWLKLKEEFLKKSGVQKQGDSLKINKKMFAMFSKGNFVVKLPKERVSELLASKQGDPYDPGNGKIMKEWIIIPVEYKKQWKGFTEEGMEFAKKLSKK